MEPRNHYPPLPQRPGSRSFRLLTLEPGEDHTDILCQLRLVDFETTLSEGELPTYDAVSYAWGERVPAHEIGLGAWPVMIRENLWQLLKHLRHRERRGVFWIDALCIDQSSNEERAAQVQMMDQIYKHARCVIVWLGLPLSDGLAAMHLIKDVASRGVDQPERISSSDLEALSLWARRAYWSRTWVVQEFLLASNVLILCGATSVSWKYVFRFLQIIERETHDGCVSVHEHWAAFLASPAYILMRQRVHEPRVGDHLTTLLVRNQHTVCQEPRDKVFAMLGLLDTPSGIRVSYTLDRRRLAHDVIRYSHVIPKDVMRHATFLSDLLALEFRAGLQQAHPNYRSLTSSEQCDLWVIPGFTVGEIISSERLQGPLSVKIAETLQRIRMSTSEDASARTKSRETEPLCFLLQEIGIDDLQTKFVLWEAISRRNGPSMSSEMAARTVPATAFLSLVTMMTSSCVLREILIGLAYGQPKIGDKVMCFLGHAAAFSMPRADERMAFGRVSGALAAVSVQRPIMVRDRVTRKTTSSFTVQSEVDLKSPAEKTEVRITTAELFVLASDGRSSNHLNNRNGTWPLNRTNERDSGGFVG